MGSLSSPAVVAYQAPEKLMPILRESNDTAMRIERQVQCIKDILFGVRKEVGDASVADTARDMALNDLATLQRVNDELTEIIERLA